MSEAYRQAGVDIDAGNQAVQQIKDHVKRTHRPEVIGGIGGFGGLFRLKGYREPVLVSATDGVGTKLKIAFAMDRHDTIGVDCVAMCVNDLVVQGAEPLFFLDYLATGKLHPDQVEAIVKGIADGCEKAGCALIGGETAEMPGMYNGGEYDVAGFTVGAVEASRLADGRHIRPGDAILGLASDGLHSNGYSLVRKVLLRDGVSRLEQPVPWDAKTTWGEVLLTPTRIYVKAYRSLLEQFQVKGGAHITGGGLQENVPRMLPPGCAARIDRGSWPVPDLFPTLAEEGDLNADDLYRTFNMGIGMVLFVPEKEADDVQRAAIEAGERAYRIGEVIQGDGVTWTGRNPF
ncbi:MAG: phosphoribosylformylglycinamidine cyclo-ligase [Firmicutes bacterium]|uniref:Phosphoribosylformylglycinamidine cyclo-ligase n=1 Tax=Melghirimyces thermohalophilus TaxID=1236220 RepID=A0A1G6PUA8_9BACL|nr:phosphoribosylformylglycinamidine cyclo-ligase [Melghirimyces thermohalophilus]MDA8354129.1 phosphoribosylformylglycinamidine cyclo-ligase [Bacillota bacterium]SDC82945.1 phosphoribosylformylglycinamidine cyclo-ligase [Melghirimyces thermohalophilus]